MVMVSRANWSAAEARGAMSIPGPILGVTCHWEGPGMGWPWPHSQCARKVRAIQRFHQGTRGWADIAYNALACGHGYVYVGRGPGVRSAANGESRIGGNDRWYAVCYLAGIGDEFTAEGQAAMLEAIAWLRSAGGAGPAVNGHRDHHPTDCPGDVIYRWVKSGLPPAATPILGGDEELQLSDEYAEDKTVRELYRRMDRFMEKSTKRESAMLTALAGVPDEIAAAVAADIDNDLAAGGGIEPSSLRRIVYAQASRAINSRLGSLDNDKEQRP